jgi:hypothetical protein
MTGDFIRNTSFTEIMELVIGGMNQVAGQYKFD